jgi:predicted nucleic acid-binding protein
VKAVFVDTSGFYALLDGTDPLGREATERFTRAEREGWRLFTTSYVVQETWAVIQARLGWDAVDDWRDRVLSRCEIIWVDETLHALGEARCRQARQRRLSLTDCVSIETMRRQGCREFIGTDEHFRREGFVAP